jgi:hypothetical protein
LTLKGAISAGAAAATALHTFFGLVQSSLNARDGATPMRRLHALPRFPDNTSRVVAYSQFPSIVGNSKFPPWDVDSDWTSAHTYVPDCTNDVIR